MNYIVFDLEATCWKDRSLRHQSEIIEIGAVKMNGEGEVLSEFSEFIRPKLHPELSDFCKELTTITQAEIDAAHYFPEVIAAFQDWIDLERNYLLCSWGFYDKKQLRSDCELNGLPTGWTKNHISLKHQYSTIKKLNRPIGMGGALKMEKLKLEGTHHRGIDDARNISKIFLKQFSNWRLK